MHDMAGMESRASERAIARIARVLSGNPRRKEGRAKTPLQRALAFVRIRGSSLSPEDRLDHARAAGAAAFICWKEKPTRFKKLPAAPNEDELTTALFWRGINFLVNLFRRGDYRASLARSLGDPSVKNSEKLSADQLVSAIEVPSLATQRALERAGAVIHARGPDTAIVINDVRLFATDLE